MNLTSPISLRRQRRGGVTFIELMFAVTLSSVVAIGIASLMVVMGRANRKVFGETLMRQHASEVFQQIENIVRSGERNAGGVAVYSEGRIAVWRAATGARVRTEIRFDAAGEEKKLLIDHDSRSDADELAILSEPNPPGSDSMQPFVSDVEFTSVFDSNTNSQISSAILVLLTITDNGKTQTWLEPSIAENQITLSRTIVLRAP